MSAYADGFHGHTSRCLHVHEDLDGFFTVGLSTWVWVRVVQFLLIHWACALSPRLRSLCWVLEDMVPSSRGVGCVLLGGSAMRRFCRHGHEVYDGFSADGSVVTWDMVLKVLRERQWQGYGPRFKRISVPCCLRELLFCHFLREVAFYFRTLSWFGSGTGKIRKWPGRVLLDGLGAIPGSLAEVEGGFAFAWLNPDAFTLTYSNFQLASPAVCASMVVR